MKSDKINEMIFFFEPEKKRVFFFFLKRKQPKRNKQESQWQECSQISINMQDIDTNKFFFFKETITQKK